MNNREIKSELEQHADEKYRNLSAGLLPGVHSILGVRIPELRRMAKQMARREWRENLQQLSDDTFEEIMLQGMIIGYADCPVGESWN